MIMALAMQGDGVKALELFERMGLAGVVPDSVSYLAVLLLVAEKVSWRWPKIFFGEKVSPAAKVGI